VQEKRQLYWFYLSSSLSPRQRHPAKARNPALTAVFFSRDYDDGTLPFENATEWRKLKIINRDEVNYRE